MRGVRLYESGQFDRARAEFEAAYAAVPEPAILFNIAQCHRQAGHAAEAIRLFRAYVAAAPRSANRAEVEALVAALEKPTSTNAGNPDGGAGNR